MSTDGQGTYRNMAENFNRLSRAHERYRQTDDRQTEGRATANSLLKRGTLPQRRCQMQMS